jgi:hypothetical protein
MFRKKDQPGQSDWSSRPDTAGLDPELAELMDLEAAERGEAGFVASASPGPGGLDPELQQLMDLEAEERGEAGFGG